MTERYKVGDRLYSASVHGAEDYGDGMKPAEVSLSTYIVRTIRRRPRRILLHLPSTITPTVTAWPSEYVKEGKSRKTGKSTIVFEKGCPGWMKRQWRVNAEPGDLSRTKSGAYRAALADLRKNQKGEHYAEPLDEKEFNMLVGRLKSAITRTTTRRRR